MRSAANRLYLRTNGIGQWYLFKNHDLYCVDSDDVFPLEQAYEEEHVKWICRDLLSQIGSQQPRVSSVQFGNPMTVLFENGSRLEFQELNGENTLSITPADLHQ